MWFFLVLFFLMIRRPPRSTRTDTLFPYTTLCLSVGVVHQAHRTAERGREVAIERPAEQPGRVGILDRTCGCGKRARNADADAAAPAGLNLDLLDEVSYCAYGSGIVPARRRQASASEDRAVGREGGSLDLGAAEIHPDRSEEHTSELQSLMRISYAVFCLKKK